MDDTIWSLTTTDNPFDPVTEFDKWLEFDNAKGYNTCGYLARIAHTSSELSDKDNAAIINEAIDAICTENILAVVTNGAVAYKRIVPEPQGS